MDDVERSSILAQLQFLKDEHRALDAAVERMRGDAVAQLELARLKKRKLNLKDQIAYLQDKLSPDIIA